MANKETKHSLTVAFNFVVSGEDINTIIQYALFNDIVYG